MFSFTPKEKDEPSVPVPTPAKISPVAFSVIFIFIILVLNGIFNYFAIYAWGIVGAAIVTSSLLWISGILSLALFCFYLKKSLIKCT